MLLLETSSLAYHGGMLTLGTTTMHGGGDPLRFYTKPPQASCGIARQARTLSVCILHHHGAILGPQHCTAHVSLFPTAPTRRRGGGARWASASLRPGRWKRCQEPLYGAAGPA